MSSTKGEYVAAPMSDTDTMRSRKGDMDTMRSKKNMDVEIVESQPEKEEHSCCQKFAFYMCWVGFAFIFAGCICAFIMGPIIRGKILKNLPISEESDHFDSWKRPPVTPLLMIRVFNLTNEREFLNGLESPILQELGPYTYREKMQKTKVIMTNDGSNVEYEVKRRYDFAADLSEGSEDDVVLVPNVPLFGAMQNMQDKTSFTKEVFEEILESYDFGKDTGGPFIKLSVHEFLWGYKSILMSLNRDPDMDCNEQKSANADEPVWDNLQDWGFEKTTKTPEMREKKPSDCELSPNNLDSFGVFYGRNGTSLDNREIGTGINDLSDKGMMKAWDGQTELNYWDDDAVCNSECNVLAGTREPSVLPINLDKRDYLDLFIGQLCRKMRFKYVQEVYHDEFKTFRYSPDEASFDSPEDTPANGCYCIKEPCFKSGIMDYSSCSPGSPVGVSWPHFLNGDPDLRRAVVGLNPDPKLHRFYMDIHPTYGFTLAAMARFQMNVHLSKSNGFSYFENMGADELDYPFMWLEEGILGPSEVVSASLTNILTLPDRVKLTMALAGVFIGFLLLIPEIAYWIRSCIIAERSHKNDDKDDDEEEAAMKAALPVHHEEILEEEFQHASDALHEHHDCKHVDQQAKM